MKIGIIGPGNIGGTLGAIWAERGHEVMYGLRPRSETEPPGQARSGSLAEAARFGEAVLLAVPWAAVQDVIAAAGDLTGKIVIDATNMGGDATSSGAEKIASWAPVSRVVKSFNQAGWETLRDPMLGGHRAVTFVAGDDPAAKEVVLGLGRDVGLEMIDAGALREARLLEALASLWIQLAFRQGLGRDFAFGLLRRS